MEKLPLFGLGVAMGLPREEKPSGQDPNCSLYYTVLYYPTCYDPEQCFHTHSH